MKTEEVIVKEKQGLFIGICLIFFTFSLGIFILLLMLGGASDGYIFWVLFLTPVIIFAALICCSPLLHAHEDIYTFEKMIRRRNGKVLFEISWEIVESISYTKPCLLGWLSFGGNYAFFIKCKEGFKKKGINAGATMFNAHYREEDVYKIQKIIPIHINM